MNTGSSLVSKELGSQTKNSNHVHRKHVATVVLDSSHSNDNPWDVHFQLAEVQHARGRLLDALRARANSAATSVLSAKYRLGCVLHYQGLTQEALPLVRKLLASCESIYGPAHEETSACAGLLALLLQARGNYSEAEKLLRPALEGCRWGLNQQALKYSYQLAYLLTEMGNYSEAVVLYRRVLDEQIRQIGSEHPETLTAMSGLATVLKAMPATTGNRRT